MTRTRPAGASRRPRLAAAAVWPLIDAAKPWLAGAVVVGLGQAMLLVIQAAILSSMLVGALYLGLTAQAAARDSLFVVLLALGQGLLGSASEACTETAARRAKADTRQRALAMAIRQVASGRYGPDEHGDALPSDEQGAALGPGGLATLIGAGLDELDPFVGRVLPRAVLALAVPALLLAWIGHLDLISAGLACLALLLAPVLAGL